MSSAIISVEGQELISFSFSEEGASSLVSNPLYQPKGNAGANPLFEAKSDLTVSPIFNTQTSLGGELRCENGQKKENNICGETNHF